MGLIFTSALPTPQLTDEGSPPPQYATNGAQVQDSAGNLYYVTMAEFTSTLQGNPVSTPSLMIYKSANGGRT